MYIYPVLSHVNYLPPCKTYTPFNMYMIVPYTMHVKLGHV
jgi:hypothetical protein